MEFCHNNGFDYVSCSPFRVPIARLAAAQAVLKNAKRTYTEKKDFEENREEKTIDTARLIKPFNKSGMTYISSYA